MAVSGWAGPGEPGSLGATPAGCGSRVFPAAGHLALRPCRVQTGFRGGGGQNGGALGDAPETPREVSRVPGAAEERAGPGQDRTLSLRCG